MTGDWEIFRLGEYPPAPNSDPNLSRGTGTFVTDLAPAKSPNGDWIAFVSLRDGNWEIYISAVDGTVQRRITENEYALDLDPVWSPDGTKLAYQTTVDGNWEIHLFNLQTGEDYRLTDHPANDINPFWSPDSSKLLFQSDREDGLWQIYELNVTDIANPVVTRLSDGRGDDHDPQYSGDGSMIAFRSERDDGQSAIYIMTADGQDVLRISELGGDARNHAWSPDDTLIAYQSDLVRDVNDLYVYELETQHTRLITNNEGIEYEEVQDTAPTWGCDSMTLFFTSDVDGDNDIYSVNVLPIDAPPINVDKQATQLTFDSPDNPHDDRDPLGYPNEEDASHMGRLPPKWTGD